MLQARIWIDADACPGEVRQLVFKASARRQIRVTMVANQVVHAPAGGLIDTILVPQGMNIADRKIVELCVPGDLVITADIPLAADVVAKGAQALNPRGELYTDDNVGALLAARNLMDGLRGSGQITGGPAPYGDRQRRDFANQFDRWLAKAK